MAVLGAQQSALEAVLLKRRVMGPSWLTLACPTRVDTSAQVTHHPPDLHRITGRRLSWGSLSANELVWRPAKDGSPGVC